MKKNVDDDDDRDTIGSQGLVHNCGKVMEISQHKLACCGGGWCCGERGRGATRRD